MKNLAGWMKWLIGVGCTVGTLLTLCPAALRAQGRAWVAGPITFDSTRLVALRTAGPWIVHGGERVTIYARPASYAEAHAQKLLQRADRAAVDNLRLLGLHDYPLDARLRAYMLAAAFVEYLMRTDRSKFVELWHRGVPEARAIYAAPLADVEAHWDAGLPVNAPPVARIDLVAAQRAGCRN